jgi:hypothetical protein
MKLPAYLKSLTPEGKEAFAARLRRIKTGDPEKPYLRVPIHYLYLLEKEKRTPAAENCWMYVEASHGAVTLTELRPNVWPKKTASESAA